MGPRRTLQVGLIGHGFMGKAHSNAWRQAPRFFDLPADVRSLAQLQLSGLQENHDRVRAMRDERKRLAA